MHILHTYVLPQSVVSTSNWDYVTPPLSLSITFFQVYKFCIVHDFISLYLIFSLGLNQIRQKLAKQINFQFNFFIAAMTSKVDHSHQNWYENVIKVNGVIIIPSTWKMSLTVSDHYIHWQFSCETVSGFFQTVLYLIPVLDIRLNYPQPLTGVKLKGILVCTTMQVVQLFWSMTLPPHTWTATWTLLDLINIVTAIPN